MTVSPNQNIIIIISCRLWCEWRPAWSSGSASSIQSRPSFVIVYTGSPYVEETTSSWIFSFTSISMVSLLKTSWRCLYWNQLFRPSPVFARRHKVIVWCREQKKNDWATKLRHFWARPLEQFSWRFEAPCPASTCQRLKSYLFKQCWCVIQPKRTFASTFRLMHLHSSVRSIFSMDVTFLFIYLFIYFVDEQVITTMETWIIERGSNNRT